MRTVDMTSCDVFLINVFLADTRMLCLFDCLWPTIEFLCAAWMPPRPRLRNLGAPSRSSSTSSRTDAAAPESAMLFLRSPQPSAYLFDEAAPNPPVGDVVPIRLEGPTASPQSTAATTDALQRPPPPQSREVLPLSLDAPPSQLTIMRDAEIYHRRWSHVVMGATSGFLFSIACFVFYCCYRLMSPYMGGISFGILLSIVLHPKTRHDKLARAGLCVSKMEAVNVAWGPPLQAVGANGARDAQLRRSPSSGVSVPPARRSLPVWLSRLLGSWLSLVPFVRHAVYEGALFMGMQKLPNAVRKRALSKKKVGSAHVSLAGCVTSIMIFVTTATMLTGFFPILLLHVGLLIMFVILVPILTERTFAYYMERLWKVTLMMYFCCGLVFCLFTDIVVVTQTVQHTTSVVVESSKTMVTQRANWTEIVLMRNKLLSDFVAANNLTEVVDHMRKLEPLLANLSWSFSRQGVEENATGLPTTSIRNWTDIVRHVQQAYQRFQSSTVEGEASFVQSAVSSITDKSRYVGMALLTIVLKVVENVVNVFDGVYEVALFVFVFKYLTQLKHTVVYYLIDKMLSPLHHPLAKDHAAAIERDITISFETLFQSFWHITWFHFCTTFCCFRLWGSPLPFISGLVAVAMALFPFVPKWLSPCMIKFLVLLGDRLLGSPIGGGDAPWSAAVLPLLCDYELLTFAAVGLLVMNDEWLLSVERGLRGTSRQDSRGVVREQLPTFLVGTCIILGLVVYGLRGVLLGPLTVIVARTIFDNWDSLSSGVLPTPPGALRHQGHPAAAAGDLSRAAPPPAAVVGASSIAASPQVHRNSACRPSEDGDRGLSVSPPLIALSPLLASANASRNSSFSMTLGPSSAFAASTRTTDVVTSRRDSTSQRMQAPPAAARDDVAVKSYKVTHTPELLRLKRKAAPYDA